MEGAIDLGLKANYKLYHNCSAVHGAELKTLRLNVDGVAIGEIDDDDGRSDYLIDALGSVTGVNTGTGGSLSTLTQDKEKRFSI